MSDPIEKHVRAILAEIGEDPSRDGLSEPLSVSPRPTGS
jgi:GTP cyclohydrolase I